MECLDIIQGQMDIHTLGDSKDHAYTQRRAVKIQKTTGMYK